MWGLYNSFVKQVTESDDIDKKKIKVEDAPDDQSQQSRLQGASTSPNHIQQTNQSDEILSTDIAAAAAAAQAQATTLSADTVTSSALPTTVITTQRHRMITTAGQIR